MLRRRVLSSMATVLVSVWLLSGVPAAAHHSFAAEYDREKPIKLSGTVTRFDLTNPHSWIYLEAKGPDGNVSTWGFETASLLALYRRGFKKDTLKAGMQITIEGFLAKDGTHTGNGQKLTLPDGKVVILGTEENPG
jgi:hypothetical protein